MQEEPPSIFRLPVWKELVETAKSWEPGTVHTHKEIARIMGVAERSQEYYNCITSAKRHLIEEQVLFESVPGVGYRVVQPDEYAKPIVGAIKSANRRIQKAAHICDYAPIDKMQPHKRQEIICIADRIRAHAAFSHRMTVDIKVLLNAPTRLLKKGTLNDRR